MGTAGTAGTLGNLSTQGVQGTQATLDGTIPEVGFRKRLSKFWTIVTEVGQQVGETKQNVSAFLEWQNRY